MTQHALYHLANPSTYYLLSTLSRSPHTTTVIAIDPCTGCMHYRGIENVDIFPNEHAALLAIGSGGPALRLVERFPALLGYLHGGSFCCLAVAMKVKCELLLPPSHEVFSIEQAKWIKLPLSYCPPNHGPDPEHVKLLSELDLSELHFYYCETYDITHTFPNVYAPDTQADPAYIWNAKITTHFDEIGMRHLCVGMLQGMAMSLKATEGELMDEMEVSLIVRKEIGNPATRHLGRGFNETYTPGNEVECELLLWTKRAETVDPVSAQQSLVVVWSSFVWRRGTVPLWWKTHVWDPHNLPILDDRPHTKCEEYWKKLLVRYGVRTKIRALSLLNIGTGKPEKMLSDAYAQSVSHVKTIMNVDLTLNHFDWHATFQKYGLDETATQLWRTQLDTLRQCGTSAGTMRYTEVPATGQQQITRWDYTQTQKGVLRINCLDSLDRTNMVSFLLMLKVVPELCRLVGVGGTAFVGSPTPYPCADANMEKLKSCYGKSLIHNLVVLFIANGDVLSHLYTGTAAMFTQNLRSFTSDLPTPLNDVLISIQRRISNVLEDARRTRQYDLLLGKIPSSLFSPQIELLSFAPGGCVIVNSPPLHEPIPSMNHSQMLLEMRDACCTVSPGIDCVECVIVLPHLSCVSEMVLSIRHPPGHPYISPIELDMYVGQRMDDATPVFQGLRLPWCEDRTELRYTLPPQVSGVKEPEKICVFNGQESAMCVRVVVLVFYGSNAGQFMNLGNVQLYGKFVRPNHAEHDATIQERLSKVLDELNDLMLHDSAPHVPDIDKMDARRYGLRGEALCTLYSVQDAPLDSDDDDDDWEEVAVPSMVHGSFASIATSHGGGHSEEYKKVRDFLAILLSQYGASYPAISFTMALELEAHRLKLNVSARRRDTCFLMCGFNVAMFDPNLKVIHRDSKMEEAHRSRLKSNMCSNVSCRKGLTMLNRSSCVYCRMSFCGRCVTSEKIPIIEFDWPSASYTVCQKCRQELAHQSNLLAEINKLHRQTTAATMALEIPKQGSAPGYRDVYVNWLRQQGTMERHHDMIGKLTYTCTDPTAANPTPAPRDVSFQNCAVLTTAFSSLEGAHSGANTGGGFLEGILQPCGEWTSHDTASLTFVVLLPHIYRLTELSFYEVMSKRKQSELHVSVQGGLTLVGLRPITPSSTPWAVNTSSKSTFVISDPEDIMVRVLCITVSNVPNGPTSPTNQIVRGRAIHLGHLEILGIPLSLSPMSSAPLDNREGYSTYLPQTLAAITFPTIQFEAIVPSRIRYVPDYRTLQLDLKKDISFSGFRLDSMSGAMTANMPQVKTVRVTLRLRAEGSSNSGDAISQVSVGEFIIPQITSTTSLFFPLPRTYPNVRMVCFEFLSFYERMKSVNPLKASNSAPSPFFGTVVLCKALDNRNFETASSTSGLSRKPKGLSSVIVGAGGAEPGTMSSPPSSIEFQPCRGIQEVMMRSPDSTPSS
eukprot:PhF_6_TR27883/c0_g1_i1/m.40827